MILPTIHTNGTSAAELIRGYLAAWHAIKDAAGALRDIEFNARDYYVAGPEAWPQAEREQRERFHALEEVANELMQVAEHCQAMIDDKEARMKARIS